MEDLKNYRNLTKLLSLEGMTADQQHKFLKKVYDLLFPSSVASTLPVIGLRNLGGNAVALISMYCTVANSSPWHGAYSNATFTPSLSRWYQYRLGHQSPRHRREAIHFNQKQREAVVPVVSATDFSFMIIYETCNCL